MLRTYQIIDCRYTDEFDMETFALVLDVEADVLLPVVINDYYYDHYSEHEYGIYETIKPGDFVKGCLCINYEHLHESTGEPFFRLREPNGGNMNPTFVGEFKVVSVEEDGRIILQHPDYDITLTTNSGINKQIENNQGTLCISGELGLETFGKPWQDKKFNHREVFVNYNKKILCKYLDIVTQRCRDLVKYLNDVCNEDVFNVSTLHDYVVSHGNEITIGNLTYVFHGVGCSVYENGREICGWDFGGSNVWCSRVDPYKMSNTLWHNGEFRGVLGIIQEDCRLVCEKLTDEGVLEKKDDGYSVNFVKLDSKDIAFPENYDEIKVVCHGKERIIPRSVMTDRFIRKSKRVYSRIDEMDMNTELHFYLSGKEVGIVLYNPCYFEPGAVDSAKRAKLFDISI